MVRVRCPRRMRCIQQAREPARQHGTGTSMRTRLHLFIRQLDNGLALAGVVKRAGLHHRLGRPLVLPAPATATTEAPATTTEAPAPSSSSKVTATASKSPPSSAHRGAHDGWRLWLYDVCAARERRGCRLACPKRVRRCEATLGVPTRQTRC